MFDFGKMRNTMFMNVKYNVLLFILVNASLFVLLASSIWMS